MERNERARMPLAMQRGDGEERRMMFPSIRWVTIALVLAIIVAGAIASRPPTHATIEVGPEGGSFYQTGLRYKKFFADRGIDLELRPNDHSLEIVKDVANPKSGIDIGFEAQDVSMYVNAPVFTVGRIQLQPLYIFANADLGRRIGLTDLRGRKIVMPPRDSATSDAAMRTFELYDITPDNSSFTFMPLDAAVKELRAGHFQAGVMMLAPENATVRDLASFAGLRLVPINEAKAIANELPFLRPVVLPRGIYNIADGIPPLDVPMLAGTVDVVIRAGLHPVLVYTLLDAMALVHRGATLVSSAGAFPTDVGTELSVPPLVQEYYRSGTPWLYRNLPPWVASFVDQYLLIALCVLALGELYRGTRYLSDAAEALAGWVVESRLASARKSLARTGRITRFQRMLVKVASRASRSPSGRRRVDELLTQLREGETGG